MFHNVTCTKSTSTTTFKNGKVVSESWDHTRFKATITAFVKDRNRVLRYKESSQDGKNLLAGADFDIGKDNGLKYVGIDPKGGSFQVRVMAAPDTARQDFGFEVVGTSVIAGQPDSEVRYRAFCF